MFTRVLVLGMKSDIDFLKDVLEYVRGTDIYGRYENPVTTAHPDILGCWDYQQRLQQLIKNLEEDGHGVRNGFGLTPEERAKEQRHDPDAEE